MKHNHNHDNAQNAGLQLVPVRFEFTSPTAKTVCLAGTFNHWQPEAKTLHSSGAGNWWKETALAPAPTNTASSWMDNGCPTRWPGNPCPTRSAAEIQF